MLPAESPCPQSRQNYGTGLVGQMWGGPLSGNNTVDIKMICFVLLLANDKRGPRHNSKRLQPNKRDHFRSAMLVRLPVFFIRISLKPI